MSEGLHPEQIEALRKMTPAERLTVSIRFIEEMRKIRATMLRKEHPDWSAEQISEALRDFLVNARS